MSVAKWVAGGTLLGGGIAAAIGNEIAKDADKLYAVITPMLHSMDAEGIKVRLDVKLQNPTNRDFEFTQPYVEIKYNGNTIGTSQSKGKKTPFPKMDENSFDSIMITIPWLKLLFLGYKVVQDLKSGAAGMVVEVIATSRTTIFFFFSKKVKYSKEVTIRKEKAQ
jgi:hypothetical protein